MLDEIKDDFLHILVCMYSYKVKSDHLDGAMLSHLLAAEIVCMNALAENIILRVARLGDKRKDVRSIKNLKKQLPSSLVASAKREFDKFFLDVEPVLNIRHERIAHMPEGTITSYSVAPIPKSVQDSVINLMELIDKLNGDRMVYKFQVSRDTRGVNLREEIFIEGGWV